MTETELEPKEEVKEEAKAKPKRVAKPKAPKAEKPPKPEPEEEIKPEVVVEAGEIHESVSAGSKKDTAANKQHSEADPHLERHYKISPKQFKDGEYCKIRVKFGITQSLGNYESARMDVEVEDFCRPDKVEEAWNQLKAKCTSYIKRSAINVKTFLEEKEQARAKSLEQDGW